MSGYSEDFDLCEAAVSVWLCFFVTSVNVLKSPGIFLSFTFLFQWLFFLFVVFACWK